MNQPPYDPNQLQQNTSQGYEYVSEEVKRVKVPKRKKKPGEDTKLLMTWLIGTLVLAVAIFSAYQVLRPNKARARGITLGYPPRELTPEERKQAQSLAESIAASLSSGGGDAAHKETNWQVLLKRIESGLPNAASELVQVNKVRDVINGDFAGDSPGIFDAILGERSSVDCAFLRMSTRDDYEVATIRCAPTPDRVEYYDLVTYPIKEVAKMQVIDMYDYQTGIYSSDRLRWAGILESGMSEEQSGQWESVFGPETKNFWIDLKNVIKHDQLGKSSNGSAAYNILAGMPDTVRKKPEIFAMEVRALRNAQESHLTAEQRARFETLLKAPVANGKNTAQTAPLLAEYQRKQQMPEAIETLSKLRTSMKDPYLALMLARWHLADGKVAQAENMLEEIKKANVRLEGVETLTRQIKEKQAAP